MREIATTTAKSVPEDFKFKDAAEADTAMTALITILQEADETSAAAAVKPPTVVKTEQSSLLRAGLLDSRPVDAAVKASFEARSMMKSEPEDSEMSPVQQQSYSLTDTAGPLYLKRIQSLAEAKKTSRIVKYPLAPHFWSRSRAARNILITSQHDLRRMARCGGQTTSEGFKYDSKANMAFWPYPCPRPTFRTCWLYRTAAMATLHCVAMQLRVLWMCLKWDDMNTKPPNPDGKNQVRVCHTYF